MAKYTITGIANLHRLGNKSILEVIKNNIKYSLKEQFIDNSFTVEGENVKIIIETKDFCKDFGSLFLSLKRSLKLKKEQIAIENI